MTQNKRHLGPILIEPTVEDREHNAHPNPAYCIVEELEAVIIDPHIKNIAVAGNYGAGKSSVVQTAITNITDEESRRIKWFHFRAQKRKFKYLNISLALLNTLKSSEEDDLDAFQSSNKDDVVVPEIAEQEDTSNDLKLIADKKGDVKVSVDNKTHLLSDEQIEYSILQQLLYFDNPRKTPKSRFFRLIKIEWWRALAWGFAAVLSLVALCILCNPDGELFNLFVNKFHVTATTKFWIVFSSVAYLIGLFVFVCIWMAVRSRIKINSVKIKDAEFTIDNLSVFNHYLDEIIYFFASTRYNVVIFEDLDRFTDSTRLFGKLRELNRILNNSQYLKKVLSRKITFVYSVKDNLFDSTNRVKFFDYIIPVIPVINTSNAYDKLIEYLDDEDKKDLDKKDLLNLCEYFEDLRLVINIVNEYNLYKKIINLENFKLEKKKLFGIIVYKNYCPDDFAKMYNRHGVLAKLLDMKESLLKEVIASNENNLNVEKQKLANIEKTSEKWEQDLRKEYVEESKKQCVLPIVRIFPLTNYVGKQDGINYSIERVINDPELFKLLETDELNLSDGERVYEIKPFSSWQKAVSSKPYTDRLSLNPNIKLLNNQKEVVSAINKSEFNLSNSIGEILRGKTDLIDSYLQEKNDKGSLIIPVSKQSLLRYLLLHDFIDEHYLDYITYFYPNTLNINDSLFVKNVTSYDKESLPYHYPIKFPATVIKHFDAQDFLENKRLFNFDIIAYLLSEDDQIENRTALITNIINNRDFDFIIALYESKRSELFLHELLKSWDMYEEISRLSYGDKRIAILKEIFIRYCNIKDKKMHNLIFKNWINGNFGFIALRYDIIGAQRLIDFFNSYGIIFSRINLSTVSPTIANDVIINGRYSINKSNVNNIALYLNVFESYQASSLSTLLHSNIPELITSVRNRLSEYISAFPKSSKEEDLETIKYIVENDEVPTNVKISYLKRQKNKIQDASQVRSTYLNFLFMNSLIAPTWGNIYHYCFNLKKSIPLGFMRNNSLVGFDKLDVQAKELIKTEWVFSNLLPLDIYGLILDSIGISYDSLPSDLNDNHVRTLISKEYVYFTPQNYRTVRQYYPSLAADFIINNIDLYIEKVADYEVSSIEMLRVLRKLSVRKRQVDYLSKGPKFVGDVTSELADIVSNLIATGEIKVTIMSSNYMIGVLSATSNIDLRLSMGRKCLFELQYDYDNFVLILRAMGGEYSRILNSASYSWLSKDYNNVRIAKKLKENGFINDYEIVGKRIKIIKIENQ